MKNWLFLILHTFLVPVRMFSMLFRCFLNVIVILPIAIGRAEELPKLDLFLCIGQSNMAGVAPFDEKLGDSKPIPNVYLFDDKGQWIPATNPLNRFSSIRSWDGRMSPAFSFAKHYATVTKRPVGLIVNARDGSTLEEWLKQSKDEKRLYEKTLKRALEAKQYGTFKAILWHQGEGNRRRANSYPDQLKTFVRDLRNDLGDSMLLFVAGEIRRDYPGWFGDTNVAFNEMIRGIDSFLEYTAVVSSDGLRPIDGNKKNPHFDRISTIILGMRYAETVIKYQHINARSRDDEWVVPPNTTVGNFYYCCILVAVLFFFLIRLVRQCSLFLFRGYLKIRGLFSRT